MNWTNGIDNTNGSGVKRSLIMRRATQCATAQALPGQTIYSAAGGYGESAEGSWTILDSVNAAITTYTDNTFSTSGNYTYAVVHEDKAYNHSTPELSYAPVAPTINPSTPANNATEIIYQPSLTLSWTATCGATNYDVYLGTTQTEVDNLLPAALVSPAQTATSFTPVVSFAANTAYFWKVVPKNGSANAASGCPTWKFTTNSPLNYQLSRTTNSAFSSIINSGSNFAWSGTYNADDMMSDALDLTAIGFSAFRYQDKPVTSLEVNTNGFITFNLSSSASYTNSFSAQPLVVAPFWEDLVCQGYLNTSQAQATQFELLKNSVRYLITGAKGSQVLTIEWNEMEIYNNAGPSINFQLKLYEQDSRIEFVYGRMFGFNGTVNYTYSYSSGMSGSVVASTPLSGQVICQQLANVLNFSNTNTTSLSELPDCYSTLVWTPNTSPATSSEPARSITNNECLAAVVLPVQYGVQNDFCKIYSTRSATASTGITACNAATPGTPDDDVWFKFTTTAAGNYGITVNGSGGFNPVVQLFSGNCSSLTPIACVNATGNGLIETLTANNLVEATYFVRIYDANTGSGGSGNFVISVYNIVPPPVNDECAAALTLTIGNATASGNTANASASAGVPVCTAGTPGTADDDVWFKFTATSTITRISANGGSAYNVVLQYFSGSCGSLSSVGCVSSTGAAGVEMAELTTVIGNTYYIRVYHSANGATPTTGFSLLVENGIPECPVLVTPATGTVNVNATQTRQLTWNAVTSPSVGTKTYTVQLSTSPEFTSLLTLSGSSGITGTSFTIPANALAAGTLYYWRVTCANSNGTSAGCGYYTMATTGTTPSCASLTTPLAGAVNQPVSSALSWSAGSGTPTSYDVYLSTNQSQVSSLNALAKVSTAQTATTYNATGLTNNAVYYWTVIPKNASGSASGCYVSSFIVIPPPPANDNCSGAATISATSSTPLTGTVLNASQSMGAAVGTSDDDVWYKFAAVSTAHIISVEPSAEFNAVVELFSGSCGALTSLSAKNENGTGGKENLSVSGLTIGQTYYVRVYDFYATAPATTGFSIRINDVDLGISSFVTPSGNICGNTTVTVALRNYSVSAVNFSQNPVTISAGAISPANVSTSFSDVVINSGTLAAGQTQNVVVTTTYNVVNSGTYKYTASASAENDNNSTNNSITSSLQTISLPAPYILSGTGSYCAGGTGVAFTLSGSETGTTYQLFKGAAAVSGIVAGTGSALSFVHVTEDGAYRVVANSTSTNCNSYMSASAVVTVNPLWLGTTSDWNTASNWCGNVVPPANANIIISGSATNMPVLPGNVTVNNLELTESNKRLELNGRTLTVNGKISGSGVVRGSAASSIVVNGSGDMGTLKMDQTTAGTTNKLQTLTINIGTNKISDSLVIGNPTYISGTVVLNNGKLNANGNLVLVSNASGTARIGTIPATADITGNVISQRYVPAVARRSRMLSPNTSGFTCSDFKDDIFVTGAGPESNGFDASSNSQSATVNTYQETISGGRGWKAISTINAGITAGQGALVFVRGDRSLPSPQWYTAPYVSQNEVTIDFVGPVNKGNISPAITFTNTNDAASDGWNLVGNPYPSQISWPLITKTRLNNFAYIMDPATNGYVYNDGATPIASGQAFFVQANAASPAITFTESCKVSGAATSLFKSDPLPKLMIKMVKDALNSDVAWLKFSNGASFNYDPMEDALKFTNAAINMGFKVPANTEVQLNTVPVLSANTADTFNLFTNAANGNYTLNFSQFGGIAAGKSVSLLDRFTNTSTNLRTDSVYSFTISADVNSKGERFRLIITDAGTLPVDLLSISATVVNNKEVEVKWATATEKNNKGFVVEKAAANGQWEEAGFVKGKGSSNVYVAYSLTDRQAFNTSAGTLYYRIKQLDFSGASHLSNVVKVSLNEADKPVSQELTIYPNPAKGIVTVEFEQALGQIFIVDITGKTVLQINELSHKALIDISGLHAGVYFINAGPLKAKKLVVN
ncbi:MAG: T9SS type A sorting domain-containing protein [Bacteroidota bacterium]